MAAVRTSSKLLLNCNQTSRVLLDEEQLPILPEVAWAHNDELLEVDWPSIEMRIVSLVPVFQTGGREDYVKVPDCVVCTKPFPIPKKGSRCPWNSLEHCIVFGVDGEETAHFKLRLFREWLSEDRLAGTPPFSHGRFPGVSDEFIGICEFCISGQFGHSSCPIDVSMRVKGKRKQLDYVVTRELKEHGPNRAKPVAPVLPQTLESTKFWVTVDFWLTMCEIALWHGASQDSKQQLLSYVESEGLWNAWPVFPVRDEFGARKSRIQVVVEMKNSGQNTLSFYHDR